MDFGGSSPCCAEKAGVIITKEFIVYTVWKD
jgi:hypothetical protein